MAPPFDSRTEAKQFASLAALYAKIPERGFCFKGAVVEEVRTIFEELNDTTIYIPNCS
jgi:hypothetical protein